MTGERPDLEDASFTKLSRKEILERLRTEFSVPVEDHHGQWSNLWNENFVVWDWGLTSPSVSDLFASNDSNGRIARGEHITDRPKYALVPGCGRGYDVILFGEKYGYQAVGIDIAPGAIKAAADFYAIHRNRTPASDSTGSVKFIHGDFFENDWFPEAGVPGKGEFDLIYDFTFLCALPPILRQRWADRMAELLSEEGHLICLEFPLHKDPASEGPPWGLKSEIYHEILQKVGVELVIRFKPERVYDQRHEDDMVSIWRKKRKSKGGESEKETS